MKTKPVISTITLYAALLCAISRPACGQVTAFTYQGRLDSDGAPANGSYDLQFTLYNTNLTGTAIAGPITNTAVLVTNGLFTTTVDFGQGVFEGGTYWLDLAVRTNGVGPFSELAPRQWLTPAPEALFAGSASNLLGTLPTSQLTGTIPASSLSGTIPAANLSGTYSNAVNFDDGANTFDGTFFGQFLGSTFTGGTFTGQFVGDGSGLIDLNASQLTSGTLPNARLPGNVAFLNSNQVFTAQNVFSQYIGIGNLYPICSVDVLANQAVERLFTTNNFNGSVLELRNTLSNPGEYLGAIDFNNASNNYPGQIGYIAGNPTNQINDYMEFRVAGAVGLRIQADPRGLVAANLIGGYPNNSVSSINSGGNVIAGGGFWNGYNQVFSNTSGAFIGAGSGNQIGPNVNDSTIAGGQYNANQGRESFLGGGSVNIINTNSDFSVLGGGGKNSIGTNSAFSVLVGGASNSIGTGSGYSVLVGGGTNSIGTGSGYSVLSGGEDNSIGTNSGYSVVAGGDANSIGANSGYSFIGNGFFDSIAGPGGFIGNGFFSAIGSNALYSFIGGGAYDDIGANANEATIAGGFDNLILPGASYGTISGGTSNLVSAQGATVPGGYGNLAGGIQSFAAGTAAWATNDGSFVLADDNTNIFYSTSSNQFSARFTGGVRFVTAGAGMTLDGAPILSGATTNVNAATLNGQPSSAFAPAAGSTNYIQNQILTPQPASFNISGSATIGGGIVAGGAVIANSLTTTNVQATGLFRSGSETGTTDPPSPAGLVIRRVNSLSATAGNIIARTDVLTLERDGSNEGLLIRYPANVGPQTINCVALSLAGASIFFRTTLNNPATGGTVQLLTSAQRAVHAQVSFGNSRFQGHLTQVVIDRYDDGSIDDNYWVGTLTSTYNQ